MSWFKKTTLLCNILLSQSVCWSADFQKFLHLIYKHPAWIMEQWVNYAADPTKSGACNCSKCTGMLKHSEFLWMEVKDQTQKMILHHAPLLQTLHFEQNTHSNSSGNSQIQIHPGDSETENPDLSLPLFSESRCETWVQLLGYSNLFQEVLCLPFFS